ncbi:hypothetical protein PPERSA_12892 [Pseudocohnilembus persalinus]|uniref:Uncharacterized protein n=1 Tax=Pseudocohnilembus persalinus TaxID=266149 RepID=A0A0V0Q856_PSEPJ|nr:hypothetical protein PPERSA_12892 [Pseudocohnilembus persalinus]|eukprot:KRW98413.1 hypothetical protein PPERSA_12892 [Pseudocohnilembus persalinus]
MKKEESKKNYEIVKNYIKLNKRIFDYPFEEVICVNDLPMGEMIKFEIFLQNGSETVHRTHHSQTSFYFSDQDEDYEQNQGNESSLLNQRLLELNTGQDYKKKGEIQGFCKSENELFKSANEQNKDKFLGNQKQIKKQILEARTYKNVNSYINQEMKFSRPQYNKKERLQRTLLVAKGMETFDQVYGYRQESKNGKQFLQNDWHMGPFYSYNGNSKQMYEKQKRKEMGLL